VDLHINSTGIFNSDNDTVVTDLSGRPHTYLRDRPQTPNTHKNDAVHRRGFCSEPVHIRLHAAVYNEYFGDDRNGHDDRRGVGRAVRHDDRAYNTSGSLTFRAFRICRRTGWLPRRRPLAGCRPTRCIISGRRCIRPLGGGGG
jgi:hypothetical protein